MDRRERSGNANAAMQIVLQGFQSMLWTAMPGVIESFDPAKKTCEVLITLQASVLKKNGTSEWQTLPKLVDCPVFFPSGGGMTLTFPLARGDECLVVFANRCIDSWWQQGSKDSNGNSAAQVQAEFRMHDLSDGFVFAGVSSIPEVQPAISTASAELRNKAGDVKISVNPTTKAVAVATPGNITLGAGGDVNINGRLVINGLPYLDHTHGGVQTGGANTGGVA